MNKFEVIYEDDTILVCYKPAGIATQTKQLGQQDMESLLKNYRAKKRETPYIGIVHRLDQPVEGVMVFAKTQKAAAELSKQVQQRSIGKKYYAISRMSEEQKKQMRKPQEQRQPKQTVSDQEKKEDYVTLTDYLTFDARGNFGRVVPEAKIKMEENTAQKIQTRTGNKGGRESRLSAVDKKAQTTGNKTDSKKAVLEYKICGVHEDKIMLDIILHTGRHHQIRLQMAHAGYPLVGDQKYGESMGKEQLALCSYFIEFVHPKTKKTMTFTIQPKNQLFGKFI